jgi:hypothetical protein
MILTTIVSSCASTSTPSTETLEIIPPAGSPIMEIPTETVVPENQDGTIQFSGYEWIIRENGLSGPGPNIWSPENVWLDENGDLHLKISHTADGWQCAELTTTERFGFGTYQFQVDGPIDQLDPNVVLGLFNYPTPDVGADATNEIDIEYAHWGNAEWPIGNFTVWPAQSGLEQTGESFPVELNGTYTTQRFTWDSDQIFFQALHGHRADNDQGIHSWLYQPEDPLTRIPQQAMPVHINLWLFEGKPPMDGNEVEIVIHQFTFDALEK